MEPEEVENFLEINFQNLQNKKYYRTGKIEKNLNMSSKITNKKNYKKTSLF